MKYLRFFLIPLAVSAAAVRRSASIAEQKAELTRRVLIARQTGVVPSNPAQIPGGFPPGFDPLVGFDVTKFLPTVPVVRIQELNPLLRPDATRIRITWGPTTLLASNESAPFQLFNPLTKRPGVEGQLWLNNLPGIPADATVLFGKIDMEYSDGSRATADTGVYLHHIQVMNLDSKRIRKEYCIFEGLASQPTFGGQVMLGAGSSDYEDGFFFTSPNATFNSGYVTGKNDRYMISGQVVNYKNHRVDIYPTLEIEYVKEKPIGLMDVSVMLVSVTGCDFRYPLNEFMPPDGVKVFNVTSMNLTLPEDGYIINALGHIHDGGVMVKSWVEGRPICTSKAVYGLPNKFNPGHSHMGGGSGSSETIIKMGLCTNIIPVRKGDAMVLQAFFDLEKHPPRLDPSHGGMIGEMATTTMYFAPKSNVTDAIVWLNLEDQGEDDSEGAARKLSSGVNLRSA